MPISHDVLPLLVLACLSVPAQAQAQAQAPLPVALDASAEVIFDDFHYESLDLCTFWTSHRSSCRPPEAEDGSLFGPNSWPIRTASGAIETRVLEPVWYRFGWKGNGLADGNTIDLVVPDSDEAARGFAVSMHALPDGMPPDEGYADVLSGFASLTGTWAARVQLDELGFPEKHGADIIQAFWGYSPSAIHYEHAADPDMRPAPCLASEPSPEPCYDRASEGTRLHGSELDHEWNNYFDDGRVRKRGGAFNSTGVRREAPDADRYHVGDKVEARRAVLPATGGWAMLVIHLSGTHVRFDVLHEATERATSTQWKRLAYPVSQPVATHFSTHFFCPDGRPRPCRVAPDLGVTMPVDWFFYSSRPGVSVDEVAAAVAHLRRAGHPRYYQGDTPARLHADAGNLFDGADALGMQTPPVRPGTALSGLLLAPQHYRALDPDVWAARPYNAADRQPRNTHYEVAWRWRATAESAWTTPFRRGAFTARSPARLRGQPVCAQVRIRDLGSMQESEATAAACSVDTFGCAGQPAPADGPGRPYREGDPEVEWTSLTVCERE